MPRVAPVVLPDPYDLPEAPSPAASPVQQDTFRQTKFVLGRELDIFATGMRLQLQLQHDSYPSQYRGHALAALTLFWSRAYAALRDSAGLLVHGSYTSIPPLVRSAVECIGVQSQLYESEMEVYESWLANSLTQDHTQQALDLNLGRYRAAGVLVSDAKLGDVYRFVGDISATPFGGSVFLTAPESNQQRLAVAFADQAFHVGYAQLATGWLLRLCERQLTFIERADDIFNVSQQRHEEIGELRSKVESILEQAQRCRVEEQTIDGERRYLILNFRRTDSGASRRILL